MLSLSFKQSMISVCIVLSLVIPRWDSILFPVFQGDSVSILLLAIFNGRHAFIFSPNCLAEDEQIDNRRHFCSSSLIRNELCKDLRILQLFLKSRFGRGHWNFFFSHRKQIFLLCTGEQFTLLRFPVLKCSPELIDLFLYTQDKKLGLMGDDI